MATTSAVERARRGLNETQNDPQLLRHGIGAALGHRSLRPRPVRGREAASRRARARHSTGSWRQRPRPRGSATAMPCGRSRTNYTERWTDMAWAASEYEFTLHRTLMANLPLIPENASEVEITALVAEAKARLD